MTARDDILNKLRRQIVPAVELPDVVNGPWIRYDDPVAQFADTIRAVGGTCETLDSEDDLLGRLEQFQEWRSATHIFSGIPTVGSTVDPTQIDDPHDLENLDFVVFRGEFAVAENGAIWLTDRESRHRVLFFITQFLVLVVRQDDIVQTMHEAYARAQPPQPGFGLFLSGPSKTADIEQSLVIGAHGCRELQVYLV